MGAAGGGRDAGAMSDEQNGPGGAPHAAGGPNAATGPGGEGPWGGPPPGAGAGPNTGAGAGAGRRPLRRDRDEHMVAGVCGGLGRYLDMDPVIFRILFGVLIFFGGFGLLVYAAIWLFVPLDGEDRAEAQKLLAGQSVLVAAAASLLLVLGLLAVVNTPVSGLSHTTPVIVIAALIAAIPVLRARRRRMRGGWPPSAPGGWGPGAGTQQAEAWWQHKNATMPPDPAAATGPTQPGAPPPSGPDIQDAPPGPDAGLGAASAPWGYAGPYPDPNRPYPGAPFQGPYTPPPARPTAFRRLGGLAMAAALVVLGIGGVLASSGAIHVGWARGTALTVMVVGAAMAIGGFFGRTRWLIPLGVITAVPLILFSALQVPLQGTTGDVTWSPSTAAAAGAPYQLAGGNGELDLSALDPDGRTVHITAQVGAGDLVITVPRDVTVEASAHLGMGKISFLDDDPFGGLDVTRTFDSPAAGTSRGTIALTLTVGAGTVEVDRAAA